MSLFRPQNYFRLYRCFTFLDSTQRDCFNGMYLFTFFNFTLKMKTTMLFYFAPSEIFKVF